VGVNNCQRDKRCDGAGLWDQVVEEGNAKSECSVSRATSLPPGPSADKQASYPDDRGQLALGRNMHHHFASDQAGLLFLTQDLKGETTIRDGVVSFDLPFGGGGEEAV